MIALPCRYLDKETSYCSYCDKFIRLNLCNVTVTTEALPNNISVVMTTDMLTYRLP